jgi:hypothetical protein
MNIAASAVGTVTVVTIGRWADDKPLDLKVVVGGTVLMFGLAFMHSANAEFADKFALFIFIVALFKYAVPITKKLGLVK